MKVSEVFKEVAKRLPMSMEERRWKSSYICDNITEITGNRDHLAHRIINKRLGGKFSVYEWLICNGYIDNTYGIGFSSIEETLYNKVQEYRKAWCLELAREFEAKGE